jgi:thioredoxin reductase (NADPH)
MHFAGLMGEFREDQEECGYAVDWGTPHSWETMQGNVGKHIKRLNWGYTTQLIGLGIDTFEKQASFVDAHTIKLVGDDKKEEIVTAEFVLVAAGGRPR